VSYSELAKIAEEEFCDVVINTQIMAGKLRLHIVDGSYLDVWFSVKIKGRFAYHWERRMVDGSVYRYDNRPHENLKHMNSYPKHFHDGSDEAIKEGVFGEEPKEILRAFLQIIQAKNHHKRNI